MPGLRLRRNPGELTRARFVAGGVELEAVAARERAHDVHRRHDARELAVRVEHDIR